MDAFGRLTLREPRFRTQIFYARSEPTAREAELIAQHTEQPGLLNIRPEGTEEQWWIIYVFRGDHPSEAGRQAERSARGVLNYILKPVLEYATVVPETTITNSGPKTAVLIYGPPVTKPPTTLSQVARWLMSHMLNLKLIDRVEIGRQISYRTTEYDSTERLELLQAWLLRGTDMISYASLENIQTGLSMNNTAQTRAAWPHNAPSEGLSPQLDPVTAAVMLPRGSQMPSLAIQGSEGLQYILARYMVLSFPCTLVKSGLAAANTVTTICPALGFLHSSAQISGYPQLTGLLASAAAFPAGQQSGSAVGVFCAPLWTRTRSIYQFHLKAFAAVSAQTACHSALAIPTVCGFYRHLNADYYNLHLDYPLLTNSYLTIAANADLQSARLVPGHVVVALGPFHATADIDHPPFLYRSSACTAISILKALNFFKSFVPAPVISSMKRAHGTAPVLEHLLALASPKGLKIWCSGLPQTIVRQLANRGEYAQSSAIQEFVMRSYLGVQSSQMFLTLSPVGKNAKGEQVQCLDALKRACLAAGCPLAVL